MLASKFIEAELNAYIEQNRLTESPLMVKLICKAFEAYDQYRRLVSSPNEKPIRVSWAHPAEILDEWL